MVVPESSELLSNNIVFMSNTPESGLAGVMAGIDEAGRGALAGPVVAAACIVPEPLFRRRGSFPRWSPYRRIPKDDCILADSKLLSPETRESSFAWIKTHCLFGVGIVPCDVIECAGILGATQL